MARHPQRIWNFASSVLTAAPAYVTTGTTIKTMLQVKPLVVTPIIGYGWRFDIVPIAAVKLEVLTTGTINATVAASVQGDVIKYDPGGPASSLVFATTGTGYTSSGEGTIVSTRLLDTRNAWAQEFDVRFELDRELACGPSDYLRLRVTTATAINMACYFD